VMLPLSLRDALVREDRHTRPSKPCRSVFFSFLRVERIPPTAAPHQCSSSRRKNCGKENVGRGSTSTTLLHHTKYRTHSYAHRTISKTPDAGDTMASISFSHLLLFPRHPFSPALLIWFPPRPEWHRTSPTTAPVFLFLDGFCAPACTPFPQSRQRSQCVLHPWCVFAFFLHINGASVVSRFPWSPSVLLAPIC